MVEGGSPLLTQELQSQKQEIADVIESEKISRQWRAWRGEGVRKNLAQTETSADSNRGDDSGLSGTKAVIA